ncbi:hypothetical protein ACQEU3_04565 [Spirillospora sp. CA-253888]
MVTYVALIEIRYAGGQRTERDEARRVLLARLAATAGSDDLQMTEGQGNTLVVRAVVEDDGPLAAITGLDGALDRALLDTGLFEEFDVSRRLLHVAPADVAARLGPWSPDHYRWRDPPPTSRRRGRFRFRG